MIIGRAMAIRDIWSSDKGVMMAVEGDFSVVDQLLRQINKPSAGDRVVIACYNGPRSFTLAGPSKSIDSVAEAISTKDSFSSIRSKRLNVTNAFHCILVEDLREELEQVGRGLLFRQPDIPIELATESESSSLHLSSQYVTKHMRDPVYFNQKTGKAPSVVHLA